jgi:hypothetical protein
VDEDEDEDGHRVRSDGEGGVAAWSWNAVFPAFVRGSKLAIDVEPTGGECVKGGKVCSLRKAKSCFKPSEADLWILRGKSKRFAEIRAIVIAMH